MYIERALEPLVRRYSENFKIVAVTGPRQVGKTTMLKHLMEEEAESGVDRVYVTLDNTAILQTAKEDPALFLQRYRPPVLIDEIQKAPELLPYIKMIVDERDDCGSVWITGSQPLHLMKAVSESLAGRVGIVEMLGLSHSEVAGTPSEPYLPAQTTSCGAWIWRSLRGVGSVSADMRGFAARHPCPARRFACGRLRVVSGYVYHARHPGSRAGGRRAQIQAFHGGMRCPHVEAGGVRRTRQACGHRSEDCEDVAFVAGKFLPGEGGRAVL